MPTNDLSTPNETFQAIAQDIRLQWRSNSQQPASIAVHEFCRIWNEMVQNQEIPSSTAQRSLDLARYHHAESVSTVEISDGLDYASLIISRVIMGLSVVLCSRLLALPLFHGEPISPRLFHAGLVIYATAVPVMIVADIRARRSTDRSRLRAHVLQVARQEKQIFETALGYLRSAMNL